MYKSINTLVYNKYTKGVEYMLFKQMEYFIAVVECNSYTEAAERCFVSQSAISQQIKSLEKELNVELIRKKGRGFILTPAGEYFFRQGKELLEEVEKLKNKTIEIGKDNKIKLKIGYLRSYGSMELQHAISDFAKIYPEVNLDIENGTHEELYKGLRDNKIDLVINDQRRAFSQNYHNYELMNSDCYIEISKHNKLSEREHVKLDDLKNIACILVAPKDQQEVEKEFYKETLGFNSQFIFCENLEEARLMVTGNRGFLPIEEVGTLKEVSKGIKRIPLFDNKEQLRRNYCAFWKKERNNYYIEEFVELLSKLLKKKY